MQVIIDVVIAALLTAFFVLLARHFQDLLRVFVYGGLDL
jgi:hypothetical protein